MASSTMSEPTPTVAATATATQRPSPAATVSLRTAPAGDSAVQAIIAAARRPVAAPAWGALLCGAAFGLLWYLSFFPADLGPLAFLAPVPLLLLVRLERPTRWMYTAIYVTQLAAMLVAIYWLAANEHMVPAWIALSLYLSLFTPVFVLATRTATRRLRLPLVVAAPLVWTGLEFVRAHLLTGFAWYYVAHTQWKWTTLIQISDITGAYGVSFVVLTCAAATALCVPDRVLLRLRLLPVVDGVPGLPPSVCRRSRVLSVAGGLALLTATLVYGVVRMSGEHATPGPRVALVQGNFPSKLPEIYNPADVYTMHHRLTGLAVPYQPDFVFWPESGYRWPLLVAAPGMTDSQLRAAAPQYPVETWRSGYATDVPDVLRDLATQAGAALVTGLSAFTVDNEHGLRSYNSAAFSRPELGLVGRYDKRHRVIFGEYVPWTDWLPFLTAMTPYTEGSSGSFGIHAGTAPGTFTHAGFTVAPLICYEDTVPQLVRDTVAARPQTDLLADITNDGWFDHSPEPEQHLVTGLFRAVETRTPLVRAANTGVSAVIDGNGHLVAPLAQIDGLTGQPVPLLDGSGRFSKDMHTVQIVDVPLDRRGSLYVRWGDWFGSLCGIATLFCLTWTLVPRRR